MALYTQSGHPTEKLRLGDDEYEKALLSLVKFCHDVLVVGEEDNVLYLPSRAHGKSRAGPWFIGGAVVPFMEISDSLRKVFKRETGLDIPWERFVFVGENRYFINKDDGMAHDSFCKVYKIKLSAAEIAGVRLDPEEYVGGSLQPYTLKDIQDLPDPFSRQIFLDLWGKLF